MTSVSRESGDPSVLAVVFQTLRGLPRETKRGFRLVLLAWLFVIGLQVWDSWGRLGASGIAEFGSVVIGTAGVILIGLVEALRRAEGGPGATGLRQILLALPPLGAVAAALLGSTIVMLVVRVWLGTSPTVPVMAVMYSLCLGLAILGVKESTVRLYDFGQREAARVAQAEAQLSEARLATLQAQMNPHFLFNALNTVASLTATDPRAAERTVTDLADVLRMSLDRSRRPVGTLEDEVSFVKAYLGVEGQRFGSRLHVDWSIAPDTLQARLPVMAIQPLVENAIKHGIADRRAGGRITIGATRADGRLRIVVRDDGEGFPARFREGTGLGNLRERLHAMFGDSAELQIDASGPGSRVIIDIPFQPGATTDARPDR